MIDNVFYFKSINKIGGTEQFLYEIAKKYNDYDIMILYDRADYEQILRISKYVRCKKRKSGEIIKCKKAFFNYNIDAINDIEAEQYYFVSHAIYQELGYEPPLKEKKLTDFIGVSDYANKKLQQFAEKLGKDIKITTCYDPLTIEPKQKIVKLVSACRLDDKVKGGERTLKLIEELDKYSKANNVNYIWTIFTNQPTMQIYSDNVIFMKGRTNVRQFIADADYVIQLSNDMETYCYTINEALSYGVPIVTTPLSILKELDITDNEHITLNWDCSNIEEVAKLIFTKEVEPFKYIPPKDEWDKILVKGKSNYKEERKMLKKCRVIEEFTLEQRWNEIENLIRADKDVKLKLFEGDIFDCNADLQDYLISNNRYGRAFVEDITPIEEAKKEIKPEPKKTTRKTTTRKIIKSKNIKK